jgi:hypothetical protein
LSPVAPHTATLVRFDFYGDESGNEAVATKKGSYEMQGDAVKMQIGEFYAIGLSEWSQWAKRGRLG